MQTVLWHALADGSGCHDADRSAGSDSWTTRVVTVVYGPVMSFAFPDVRVKAYRNSVLYVNLVSVVDCSVLNWVEQKELKGLASDDRLFGRIAEPGWVLLDFNNNFKYRMGREDLSHVQFNPKL